MIRTSPHLVKPTPLQIVMLKVAAALLPGIAAYVWVFGAGILLQLLLASVTAIATEAACLKLRNYPIKPFITDGSAIVTAWLLALSLPPLSAWWMVVLATIIAIALAKHLYGGLGQNPFNPAMVGFAVMIVSFPAQMSRWNAPLGIAGVDLTAWQQFGYIFTGNLPNGLAFDTLASATPLDAVKTALLQSHSMAEIFSGAIFQVGFANWLPSQMALIAVAYLLGGLFLLQQRVIQWHLPVAFLAVLAGMSGLFYLIDPAHYTSPSFHLFSGAAMLGAFFIVTDPVSGPTTPRGRLIYGGLIGLLTWLIRTYGGYPDGVAFAVLIMNIATPFIDQYTQPAVFGRKNEPSGSRKKGAKA
ncbi:MULTISPECIES: RnfABCDGE type electron transport complex subunit D [Deefgea]|uniref:Ion-translocating oxidoreductase complex subunit D n=1 Tax=Deefgea chitinilytica TaxID=570276 RepID=A0ABS2CCN8_9NEIS|nr:MULTISPECIES: RnfABCDGE type electron transport complex subunit D [Deefgea]MBM5571903.1 RnfABCDGE type electron transport complex subunit D [Deefgea chitinilytica]MBM9889138.1 RnfABCDGE type electron transport complex subunit D [Deefgea sp. CFH1-16]